jgi:hypothetical protein
VWITSRRNSIAERTAWRAQIGTLVQQLAQDRGSAAERNGSGTSQHFAVLVSVGK